MENPQVAGKTPANVATLATQPGVLHPGGLILLGIFGSENDLSALVREPGGRIHKVKIGKSLLGSQVVGIDNVGVVLEKGGRVRRLDLPA